MLYSILMLATYILILCISTGFAAWVGLLLWRRLGPMLRSADRQTGLCAMMPAVAFLIVVAAPSSVLFFASVLMVLALLAPAHMQSLPKRAVWLAIATASTLAFLNPPDMALLAPLPLPAIYGASFVLWLGLTLAGSRTADTTSETGLATIFACLPLAATPLLLGHASSVATDAAILASAWFGALLQTRGTPKTGTGAQVANGFILGYLQLSACWQGAWITALASAIIWGLGLLYARHCTTASALEELTRA